MPAQISPEWGPLHGSAALDSVCRVTLSSKELLEIMRSANADQMTQALATLGACPAVQGAAFCHMYSPAEALPSLGVCSASRGCLLLHVPAC